MEDISAKVALKQLIENRGIDILKNGKLCMSVLKDMVPKDKDGLENIKVVFDKNLQLLLVDANSKSTADKQNSIDTVYKRLIGRLNEQTAREICNIFIFALGWNVSIKTTAPTSPQTPTPPINPVQQKSPIYTQPRQTQYQYPTQVPKKATKTNVFPKVAIIAVCSLVVIVGGIILLSGKGDNKDDSKNNLSSSNVSDYSQSTSNSTEKNNDDSSDDVNATSNEEKSYTENTETNNMTTSILNIEAISETQTSIEKIEIQQISDKITSEKEKKTYEFTSTEAGRYRFELSDVPQNIWFKFYIYNASMEQLDYGSGDNGDGITVDLEADTKYYLVIEQGGNTGSYTLNIGSQKPTTDISAYTLVDDSTQFTNQRNIYKFTSSVAGTYRFELSDVPQNIWFKFYLYNASMEQLDYGSGDNGDGITVDLDASTEYYFVVEQGGNTGSYTLNIGSQKSTTDISTYKSVNDSTQFTNQRNIYEFTSSVAGTYRFELSNVSKDTWFKLYLYNSSMEQLEYGSGDNGDGITFDLDAGTKSCFAVEHGGNTGNYTINYGIYKEE